MLNFTYKQSQLVQDQFLGCTLDSKFYRLNNIQKLNCLLCNAYQKKHTVQIFEILDNPDDLISILYELKRNGCFYSKLQLDSRILLVIFNAKGTDYSINLVRSVSSDFTLLCNFDLSDEELDIEDVCFKVYQLAQHVSHKTYRKEKIFTASDISPDMKLQRLTLVKRPQVN